MKVNLLSLKPLVHGARTGYLPLAVALERLGVEVCLDQVARGPFECRRIARVFPRLAQYARRIANDAICDRYFASSRALPDHEIQHVLVYEFYADRWPARDLHARSLITTIHAADPSRLSEHVLDGLSHVDSLITLSRHSLPFLESRVGAGRVRFLHLGVDVEFFRPGPGPSSPRRLFFIGRIGRNLRMLARVIQVLSARHSDLHFDIRLADGQSPCDELRDLPRVTFLERLSDEELRKTFQDAFLLLLPLTKAAANCAIVEALACGTPPVTCDVGGIRCYGGGSIYPVVPNDDVGAMVALVERYLAQPSWRDQVARAGREFAEDVLAWPKVAQAHLDAYAHLSGRSNG